MHSYMKKRQFCCCHEPKDSSINIRLRILYGLVQARSKGSKSDSPLRRWAIEWILAQPPTTANFVERLVVNIDVNDVATKDVTRQPNGLFYE